MGALDDLERFHAETREEWRAWLAANHATATGVWLVTWKASSGRPRMPYGEGVEEALCVGWVDSLARGIDDDRSSLLYTPRKAGSGWSRPNKERVARLEQEGLLLPRGVAVIEAAKADGSWSKLDEVEDGVEPDDLRAALDSDPAARANWDAFPRSVKRGLLELIVQAKRQETRDRRIATIVADAARNSRGPFDRTPKKQA